MFSIKKTNKQKTEEEEKKDLSSLRTIYVIFTGNFDNFMRI